MKEEVSEAETSLKAEITTQRTDVRGEMRQLFKEQAEQIGTALKETFELLVESYATKEKLEELQNEVDELRSEVEKLKQQIPA